MIQAVKCK